MKGKMIDFSGNGETVQGYLSGSGIGVIVL